MKPLINSGLEFWDWCFNLYRNGDYRKKPILLQGLYVNASVRRELLTSEEQGKIILGGQILQIQFENMHSGVYRAFISFDDVDN